jgi:hypothetical protein
VQASRVDRVGDRSQAGPQAAGCAARGSLGADQRTGPGLGPVFDLLHRADSQQQGCHGERGDLDVVEPPPRRPFQTGEQLGNAESVQVGVGQHHSRIPAGVLTGLGPWGHRGPGRVRARTLSGAHPAAHGAQGVSCNCVH